MRMAGPKAWAQLRLGRLRRLYLAHPAVIAAAWDERKDAVQ